MQHQPLVLQDHTASQRQWSQPTLGSAMRGKDLSGLKVCARCIYDETVPGIVFDVNAVCNYCHTVKQLKEQYGTGTPEGEKKFGALIDQIKAAGSNKKYDCVTGVSGGTD